MTQGGSPYPGLRPFREDEAHLFFGREGQSDELVRRLRRRRFLAVVGTSGSGKSSLVQAGMLPALHGGQMAAVGSSWRVACFRPGGDPIGRLGAALADVLTDTAEVGAETVIDRRTMIDVTLRRSTLGLVQVVGETRPAKTDNVLILADQFEELFRFERDGARDDSAHFVKLLLEAAGQTALPIYVVLTMRSDFLGDCARFIDLPEAINDGQYLVPRMTRDERREAIEGPAAVAGARMAPRLVNRLLNDVGDDPDQLPVMQHALSRSWDQWSGLHGDGEPIDLLHYQGTGGMREALSRHADEAYGELERLDKELARRIFQALTEKIGDDRGIRRPTRFADLVDIIGVRGHEDRVRNVIRIFRRPDRSFLMPPASDPIEADTVLDISHESLMRTWERLKRWVDEEAESVQTYRRLCESARLYAAGQTSLLQDPELQMALIWRNWGPNAAWAARLGGSWEQAVGFLDRSVAVRDAAARRRSMGRRGVILAASLGVVGLAIFAWQKSDEAESAQETVRTEQARVADAQAKVEDARSEVDFERLRADIATSKIADQQRALRGGRRLTHGRVLGLTILAEFQDVRAKVDVEQVGALLNGTDYRVNGNACSVREYFLRMSSGKLDYSNVVMGPISLGHPRRFYETGRLGMETLANDAISAALHPGLDLDQFDSLKDEKDKVIDAITVLYAGEPVYRGGLWPHSGPINLTVRGHRTSVYTLQALGRGREDLTIGDFCRNAGYMLCRFPSLYDTGALDSKQSRGLGPYCLMASGSTLDGGRTPAPICGYLRDLAGWVDDLVLLNAGGDFEARHGDYGTVLRYQTDNPTEYFIVENRSAIGLDAALMSSGLAVFHCDTTGSNDLQEGTAARHFQCALLQADGRRDLEVNDRIDGEDLFGKKRGVVLSADTSPSSRLWDGSESGLTIKDVTEPGEVIRFRVRAAPARRRRVIRRGIPSIPIPDGESAGVASSVSVEDRGAIRSVKVRVDIRHAWIGDLRIELETPFGTRVRLVDQQGGGQDDLVTAFTFETTPDLRRLAGRPAAGRWTLHVVDTKVADNGELREWTLTIGLAGE